MKDQLNQNFEKAFDTLTRRVRENHYIDKRRNIMLVWRDYIKQEKNAVNVIGAIARKTLRMEVFQRIRLVARENYMDKDACRKMNHFYRLVKNNLLKKAMVTWRKNSYAECVRVCSIWSRLMPIHLSPMTRGCPISLEPSMREL